MLYGFPLQALLHHCSHVRLAGEYDIKMFTTILPLFM